LNDKEYQRLLPFFHRKSARQRVILFLIAEGYTVGELVAMRTFALRHLKLPTEMSVYRDEALADYLQDMAFTYPNGKVIPHTSYYRLIRETAKKVLDKPMSQEQFKKYIKS
jgi:ABC-type antimicrobial peptide transport system permease subunit